VVLFFEEASPDKNIKRAMSAARAGRKLLREEEAAAPAKRALKRERRTY